ncbi:MAG: DUF2946 domain-containing protein [Roseiarcus sp.]|jgi:hypothetical protein
MAVSGRHKTYVISTDPLRGRIRLRIIALVGLWAILFNVVAATLLGAAAQANSPMFAGLDGDRIVVCTGLGTIVLDSHGNPVRQQDGGGAPMCPFCLPLMQANVLPPDEATYNLALVREASLFIPRQETVRPIPARLAGAFSPRAPPLI